MNKNSKLLKLIQSFEEGPINIAEDRLRQLDSLAQTIASELTNNNHLDVIIICTHNSRRSQVGELWIRTLAQYFSIENIFAHSGGTEATALHPNMAQAIKATGWHVDQAEATINNPNYLIRVLDEDVPLMFSKKYSNSFNPTKDYLAILVCDEASEACPIVQGAKHRVPLSFKDPKAFDQTVVQDEKYLACVSLIGMEFYYCFKQVNIQIFPIIKI